MKDIVITVLQQKIEMRIFLVCFLLACLMNVVSIVIYDTPWSELWTSFFWVLLIACAFYGLTVAVRICIYAIRSLLKR